MKKPGTRTPARKTDRSLAPVDLTRVVGGISPEPKLPGINPEPKFPGINPEPKIHTYDWRMW